MNINDIRGRLKINESMLEQEFAEQAGMFAYVAEHYIEAEYNYRIMKGNKYKEHRDKLETAGNKVTEKMIEAEMFADEKLQQARSLKYSLKDLKEALHQRGTMLIQLGILKRQELANSVNELSQ